MALDRRTVLAGLAGAVAAGALPASAATRDEVALRGLGEAIGLEIGCADDLRGPPIVHEILRHHCDVIVTENALKPANIAPFAGVRNFARADRIYNRALANGQKVHGHTLYWHESPLPWGDLPDEGDARGVYEGFVTEVLTRYPAVVSWDVFNEIIAQNWPERATQPLRQTYLLRRYGLGFVDFCFRVARAAAPNAELVLNEVGLECGGAGWCSGMRPRILTVLRRLLDMGTPIHAVGIQGHLDSRFPPSPDQTRRFVREVAALGLKVHISEMDVNDVNLAADVTRRDAQVARYYREFLDAVLAERAVTRLSFWGMTDAENWITLGHGVPRHSRGARPGLYDQDYNPKPAFHAVVEALRRAPPREVLLSARQAQRRLAELGFDPGLVDGSWGQRSQAALNRFRAAQGLEAVQQLDLPSQRLLMQGASP